MGIIDKSNIYYEYYFNIVNSSFEDLNKIILESVILFILVLV